MSCEGERCRCLHFLNNMNKSSYKHLKWPWPDLLLFTLPEFDLKVFLRNLTMESVSSTFLIFLPKYLSTQAQVFHFKHKLLCFILEHCALSSAVRNRGMCDKSSGTCIVKHQWLNPSVLISCSHAKKKKLSQAVLIPGTHGADYFPTNMQHPAEQTQNIILSASSCYHLASVSEEILTTLEKEKRRMSFWEASRWKLLHGFFVLAWNSSFH